MTRRNEAPKAAPKAANKPAADGSVLARLGIGQAVAKTITFRVIVTTLDFTSNYIVIGELTTAAGADEIERDVQTSRACVRDASGDIGRLVVALESS